tara:strand:- start:5 stop:307 length:303 start_codon:yes stop_codon:yes gene_type:complete
MKKDEETAPLGINIRNTRIGVLKMAISINKSNLEKIDWMEEFMKYIQMNYSKIYKKGRAFADAQEENDYADIEYELTCCGDEVVGHVANIRICPTCKEHI